MASEGEKIHIVFAADDKFALPLTVAILSLLENHSSGILKIYILDAGIQAQSRRLLNQSIAPLLGPHELEWLPGLSESVQRLPVGIMPSSAVWARLLIPELLPAQVDRAIYLDSDTVVLGDLAELYAMDMQGYCLWAAQDQSGWLGSKMCQIPNLEKFGIPADSPTFNSGVLLMNLAAWRKERISERLIEFALSHPEISYLADQNCINLALFGRIGMLAPKWNVQPIHHRIASGEWSDVPTLPLHQGETRILHFLSEDKPWVPGCFPPRREEFYKFWRKTSWPMPATMGD
ncbi:MAG TPA: glycosyltransferase family 8 protein [Bdellovibrionota bacterium]|jgi:lipopolysaccharide biosynthesis glycosyltransferase